MAKPKALVLRTAGTNCDLETIYALEEAGFEAAREHVFRMIERPDLLEDCRFLVVPGGFSYGDDVAAGKILANQLLFRLAEPLNAFVADGGLVLGICNGFQVLLKSGLLPWGRCDAASANRDATLSWNDSGMFVDRWVHLRSDSEKCVFLPKGEVISLPIAHGEGKFVPADEKVLHRLRADDQVALRYVDAEGNTGPAPINPNGSVDDIAGLCDPTGRVMGLMPHPERFARPTQHPQWTRRELDRADGMVFFHGAMSYLRRA
jgi:phosphoribosylformylglycinamidine synthase